MKPESFRPVIHAAFVAEALDVPAPGRARIGVTADGPDAYRAFSNVVSDSRKVQKGSLFVALKGDRVDGHDYIHEAIARGARGVICRKDFPLPHSGSVKVFPVDDPLEAYRLLAARWRREFSLPVAVVAGAVGKTTTKELLSAILQGKWAHVLKTQGSQNGYIGVPLTLLELKHEHQAAVIEVGIDEVGAMQKHMALINASAGILTCIAPEHLENLKDMPTIAREEGYALAAVSRAGGLVAINLDDPWIRPHAVTLRGGRKFYFTLKGTPIPAQAAANEAEQLIKGTFVDGLLEVSGLGLEKVLLKCPLPGFHNATNLLGAVTLARAMGLSGEEIQAGLKKFEGAVGRSQVQELPGNTVVLCDYYNANPASVEAGLETLTQVATKARQRWACLADMLELGPDEENFHRSLAPKILELKIEHVLLYGPRMKSLMEELGKAGYAGTASHFASHQDLAQELLSQAKPGDAILIKGSRSMKMEEIWKALEPHARAHWGASLGK